MNDYYKNYIQKTNLRKFNYTYFYTGSTRNNYAKKKL